MRLENGKEYSQRFTSEEFMLVTNASWVSFCVDYGARKGRIDDAERNG